MTALEAIVLGVLQGLTEFIPVSSTAHLRIAPALFGWEDPGAGFTAVIQLGTLLAVFVYFWADLVRTTKGLSAAILRKERSPEASLGWAVLVGSMPIIIAGLALKDAIEGPFRSLWVIAASLIGVALVMGLAEVLRPHRREIHEVTWRDGLVVGLFQALALVPGVSRSGSTISGALFLGFRRDVAARFSFLLSVPAIFLAGVYELWSARASLAEQGIGNVLLATVAAFLTGYASIEFLIRFLRTRSTLPFILYRIALALFLIYLLTRGVLSPMQGIQ
ncbi:MAG: undecaprenyl-diphosphatase UppP [Armatimonadetes bacterium]|nr:MAG: undecaprenyl-diphosphatase UppP [Armatimonadota bacterium]